MKPRHVLSVISCILAASACACSGEVGQQEEAAAEEATSSTAQSVVAATGNIFIWPAGPVAWNGLVGTWPISVWSTGAIGALAFNTTGLTLTGVSLVGAPTLIPGAITTPFLNAFMPVAGAAVAPAPLLGPAGVLAPNYGFLGAFNPFIGPNPAFGFGAFAPTLGATQVSFLNGAVTPGFTSFLTPTLTNSALMFTNLAAVNAFTPLTFNVTFTAASAAQAAAVQTAAAQASMFANLSIFATPIAPAALTTAAIPFTSMAYPVFVPPLAFGAPLAPIGAPIAVPLL